MKWPRVAGALAVYLALAPGLPGSEAGLDAEITGVLALALVGRLAWRVAVRPGRTRLE